MKGENLRVVELNGVTSVSTHIYEPGFPLWKAYVNQARQWRQAYSIGAANAVDGHPVMSVSDLVGRVRSFRHPEE